jgi:hypothetical protein
VGIRLAKAECMSYREKQQKNSSDSIKHRCFHSCLQGSRKPAPLSCRVGSNCTIGTTEQVIKNYLRNVYDKIGVSDRLELALFTIHHRILAEAAATSVAATAPAL